jgi:molecular chaperone DnaK (HSP70)
MTRARLRTGLAVLTAGAALGLGACGGDEGPSQEEYADELDRICLDAEEDLERIGEDDAQTPEDLVRQLDQQKEAIEDAIEELEELERPGGDAGETGERYVETLEEEYRDELLPAIEGLQEALRANDEDRVREATERLQDIEEETESDRLAEELGADRCAE